jgi:hypothetical protein
VDGFGRLPATRANLPYRTPPVDGAAPVEDGPARDADATGDLAVVEALVDEGEGGSLDAGCVHSRTLREIE